MLVPKKYSRKKIILIIALILVIWLVIIALLYFNFFTKADNQTEMVGPAQRPSKISDQLKLGSDVLEDNRFIQLKVFGSLPVQADKVGRSDPFSLPVNSPIKPTNR
ncbi:hypothetical protein KKC17_04550 [Patescibacteria group bacterium]|nr:hypothetical protein [Patescibacteria group bacterium]